MFVSFHCVKELIGVVRVHHLLLGPRGLVPPCFSDLFDEQSCKGLPISVVTWHFWATPARVGAVPSLLDSISHQSGRDNVGVADFASLELALSRGFGMSRVFLGICVGKTNRKHPKPETLSKHSIPSHSSSVRLPFQAAQLCDLRQHCCPGCDRRCGRCAASHAAGQQVVVWEKSHGFLRGHGFLEIIHV